jgi:hypothetical protein
VSNKVRSDKGECTPNIRNLFALSDLTVFRLMLNGRAQRTIY